ncbi:hypothetical protein J4436_01165 [Candidatus Woesearchaeota archaeon]|nr:hypothetical protein [Candidatus Woesearchaeota archaeon]
MITKEISDLIEQISGKEMHVRDAAELFKGVNMPAINYRDPLYLSLMYLKERYGMLATN